MNFNTVTLTTFIVLWLTNATKNQRLLPCGHKRPQYFSCSSTHPAWNRTPGSVRQSQKSPSQSDLVCAGQLDRHMLQCAGAQTGPESPHCTIPCPGSAKKRKSVVYFSQNSNIWQKKTVHKLAYTGKHPQSTRSPLLWNLCDGSWWARNQPWSVIEIQQSRYD